MSKKTKWIYIALGGVGALALAVAALFVVTHAAAAAGIVARPLVGRSASSQMMKGTDFAMPDGPMGGGEAYDQALADALGISLEDLQAAYTDAQDAAIQQAVDEGLLTQEQADQLQSRDLPGGHWMFGFRGGDIDMNALLADALGISVDDLQAAQKEAQQTLLDAAVANGDLTQEQVDLMQARSALQPYLANAYSEAYQNAVQQALDDGAITQAQADALLAQSENGFEGHMEMPFGGGHGGRGFGGDHGGMRPFNNGTDDGSGTDGTQGTSFNNTTGA